MKKHISAMGRWALTAVLSGIAIVINAQEIASPNGRLSAKVIGKNFVVSYGKQKAVELAGIEFSGLRFAGRVKADYQMVEGKRLHCTNEANEYESPIGSGAKIVVRLYNDGVAFRYEYTGLQNQRHPDEHTAYIIPEGTKRWMLQWSDGYEGFFPLTTTASVKALGGFGGTQASDHLNTHWGYPLLMEVSPGAYKEKESVFALITEANIERRQSASSLFNKGEVFSVVQDQNDLLLTGEWHTPWRVVIVGTLADIVQSTLVTDVSEPSRLDDVSWIKPGVVSWIYWANNHGSNDYNIIRKYVDMAVALRLPYVLIDAEWDEMDKVASNGGKTIEDAVAYAVGRGVKPLIWYNSSIGWINGAPGPKFRLNKAEDREKEFAWCEKIGVAGVKIDFFSGDNQANMDYCQDLLESAARHHLLVNFHGAPIPRGWQRTYPNLLSTEGVYGAEWYNNVPTFTERAARHNATLPFTRNVVGPMDYTPCAFSDSQHPHITSKAHELALTVLYESGLQHLADRPESFLAQPREVQDFLGRLPAVWDETRYVSGYPGESAVLARRSGDTWYVAGINGTDEAKALTVPLNFIKGRRLQATLFADGETVGNEQTATLNTTGEWAISTVGKLPAVVACKPRGGFVLVVRTNAPTAQAGRSSSAEAAPSRRQLFDSGWQFTRNGKTVSADLPHDWDIYEAPDPATGATKEGGGWYQGGKGEYRKTFKTPDAEVVKLHFEGVYQRAEVFINGQKAGQHAYGYTPFTVDITPYLKQSQTSSLKSKTSSLNELLVKVDNSEQPNCRWYSGSGIYRHVWMETMPALHIAENGVFVTTQEVSADRAAVRVEVTVANESDCERSATVVVSSAQMAVAIPARQTKTVTTTYVVQAPRLWSPDDPYLYETKAELKEAGKVVDEQHAKFGIRSFSFDAERGFVLNGRPLLINGACVHHDDGVLGAMAFDAAEIRKVRQMKEAGFNLIRTSHNPTTRAFLDTCDSIGMLVIDEAFDGWRTAKNPYDYATLIDSCYREDIHAMVMRDRNHPSIISWSLGNEVIERKDIRVITTARKLKQAVQEKDDTRPVTEALCAWDSDWEIYDPHAEVLDVVGYNYMIHKHEGDHRRDPQRVMWQTESYPRDAFKNWQLVQRYPYIVGDIVWTGLDYLGESGIGRTYYEGERPGEHYVSGGQPDWHGAYCGDVDITGWRKPVSHYREMLWRSEKGKVKSEEDASALCLAVKEPDGYHGKIRETAWSVWPTWQSWNWPGWEGKPVEVEVYTKAPEVKLYLNDNLIGTKAVSEDTEYKAVFTVDYEPGRLRAEAGALATILYTAGKPARLRLTADRSVITADGQDLSFITVEVVDGEGRVCPDAAIPCEATVKGQGSLLAFASADMKDREPYTSPRVTTWKGRAMLVIRSTEKKGRAEVSIKSSLPAASLTIKSEK